jgi:hypothetical protein
MNRRRFSCAVRFGLSGPALAVAFAAWTAAVASTLTVDSPASGASAPISPASNTTSTATVMGWGDNSAGELGNGTLTPSSKPVGISGLAGVSAIASGGRHNLALTSGGTVVSWGDNSSGQLGDGHSGTNASAEVPVSVAGISGATSIAAGTEHSLALLSNGTVMAWGGNISGQLGDGSHADNDVPIAVSGLSAVRAIAAGELFSLALLANGTVVAWGSGVDGQLGDGAYRSSDIPVAVTGLSGVTAIAAGGRHALAVLSNGTMMAWGDNESGQLGNGDSADGSSDVPVAVQGITKAVAASAGEEHSVALLKNGSVMAWGDNGFFQLARPNGFPGGVGSSDVPLPITGIGKAAAIAAGGLFTLALTSTGTVQAWGDDAFGQLGNGSTTTGDTPVTVRKLTGADAISAGGVHSLALTAAAGSSSSSSSSVTSTPWRVEDTQNPVPPHSISDVFLSSVSAFAGDGAWAVGTNGLASSTPLAEEWNGTSWTSVAVPMPSGATQATLQGVDALSPSDAWAVGRQVTSDGTDQTLIEHWNGTKWHVVPSPDPATGTGTTDELEAVGGASANDLWAVGFYSNGSTFIAMLFEHWNGRTWTFVPPPTTVGTNFAEAVTAISPTDVWVVGDTATATNSAHWDGKNWQFVSTPFLQDGKAPQNFLTGVSGTSPDDVWASGYEDNVDQLNLRDPYLLHWNGRRWSLVEVPDPGTEGSQLADVTAISPTDVWAVGETLETDGALLSLSEVFNGTTWSVTPSLDPGQLGPTPDSTFAGSAATTNGQLFAVGSQEQPGPCCLLTLAEGANG